MKIYYGITNIYKDHPWYSDPLIHNLNQPIVFFLDEGYIVNSPLTDTVDDDIFKIIKITIEPIIKGMNQEQFIDRFCINVTDTYYGIISCTQDDQLLWFPGSKDVYYPVVFFGRKGYIVGNIPKIEPITKDTIDNIRLLLEPLIKKHGQEQFIKRYCWTKEQVTL